MTNNLLKRFLVFQGEHPDSSGGWNDFKASFDTISGAKAVFPHKKDYLDFDHIVDTRTGSIVWDWHTGDIPPPEVSHE